MGPPCSDRIPRVPPYSNGRRTTGTGLSPSPAPLSRGFPFVLRRHGLVRVRSPLLAESRLISFPPATEMFHFAGFAPLRVTFTVGLPHSDIHGSKPVRGSPWLFAAYHVLHRLSMPRHPPDALKALDHSHYRCPSAVRRTHRSVGAARIPRIDTDERFDKKNSGSRPCRRHERHLLFTMVSQILGRPTAAGHGANAALEGNGRSREGARGRRPRAPRGGAWWSQTGSNRRPPACKAGALPAELWPRRSPPRPPARRRRIVRWWAWIDSNYRPHAYQACALTT